MATTNNNLLDAASEIRDAELAGENTALRVGSLLIDIIEYLTGFVMTAEMEARLSTLRSYVNTQLATKADVVNIGGALRLKVTNQPLVSLMSIEAVHDTDGLNNKMWWSADDGKLKYKHSGTVYDLGGPPQYSLYYCGDKIYKWTGNGFTQMMMNTSNSVVLAAMSEPDTLVVGETYYDEATNQLVSLEVNDDGTTTTVRESPVAGVSYLNAEDGQTYSLGQNTLEPNGLGIVFLDSMGEDIDGGAYHINPGDLVYDDDYGCLKRYYTPEDYNIISCSERCIYFNKRTDALYGWRDRSVSMRRIGAEFVSNFNMDTELYGLSARAGVTIKTNVDSVNDKLNALIGALANGAFSGNRPSTSDLDWGGEE